MLMALGIAALNAALVVCVLAAFNREWRGKMRAFFRAYGKLAFFLLSAGCVVGTLLMQYAGALPPCVLCWWQRIFMYPILIISFIAIVKNTDVSEIADYFLALSIFGAAISLYQHLLQMLPAGALIPCDASGDCAVRSVFEFNYITIPWMALSVFTVFIFIALFVRKRS